MTVSEIIVEDEQLNLLREEPAVYRIKKIMDEAKEKNLFKNIEDPSEWQREIRKEWDLDFSYINNRSIV